MPEDSAGQGVPCAKCGTRNPRDAAACLYCGAGLLATAGEQRRVPVVPRLLVSLGVGLLVLLISAFVAYGQYCASAIRYLQDFTLVDIGRVAETVEAYRQEKHVLPKSLRDLPQESLRVQVDERGSPVDRWGQPLHYWADATHYRITSYGYDGRPGGVGLEYDLSSDDLPRDKARWAQWPKLPPEAMPTFRQFVTDRGLVRTLRSYMHGSGHMMFLASVLGGVVAFVLAFISVRVPAPFRGRLRSPVITVIATAGATLYMAACIAAFHAPSGH